MKRCAALRDLSNEHHQGLVLAKRAKKAAGTTEAEQVWREIQARFAVDIEPHFQAEEVGLLPALEQKGEAELVRRTHADHAGLRRLISEVSAQAMIEFAELLEQHIRFEERELFEVAQQKLSAVELAALVD